jgi:hypothetical protein
MHFEVLVEEPSAEAALGILLPKLLGATHTYRILNFGDKQTLLEALPIRLRAYAHWIPPDYRIIVLIDKDRQDCLKLKAQLVQAAHDANLHHRVLNRIAVEELEAWWFGDIAALRAAYPRLPATLGKRSPYRDPDAIAGGTWEALDRELKRAGYREGLFSKTVAARRITPHLDLAHNRSHSFQVFCHGVRRIANIETGCML